MEITLGGLVNRARSDEFKVMWAKKAHQAKTLPLRDLGGRPHRSWDFTPDFELGSDPFYRPKRIMPWVMAITALIIAIVGF
jgi:hypothetical protein